MSQIEPFVSVVMPVYNGARSLDRAIRSVLGQTHENLECVVLDNGSYDATADIIAYHAARDARVRARRNRETLPVMENHNAVVELMSAESDFCQILQADDELAPACLSRKIAVATANPGVAIVGAYADRGGQQFPREMPAGEVFAGPEVARWTLLGQIYPFVSPSALLFRADVVRARQPFYNEAVLHGDVQACYEILAEHDFGFVHQPLTLVGVNRASVTSRVSAPLNRLLASNLDLFVTYGPRFLEQPEYDARLDEMVDGYYRRLASALLERREAAFWKYHRCALESAGLRLAPGRLLSAVGDEIRRRPRASARRFVKSFRLGSA